MRPAFLLCVSLLVSTRITAAQQADDLHLRVSRALQEMDAPSWQLREKGFEQLPSLEELSASPQEVDRVKVGIIRLLISEVALIREYKRTGKVFTTEEHSEYYCKPDFDRRSYPRRTSHTRSYRCRFERWNGQSSDSRMRRQGSRTAAGIVQYTKRGYPRQGISAPHHPENVTNADSDLRDFTD